MTLTTEVYTRPCRFCDARRSYVTLVAERLLNVNAQQATSVLQSTMKSRASKASLKSCKGSVPFTTRLTLRPNRGANQLQSRCFGTSTI